MEFLTGTIMRYLLDEDLIVLTPNRSKSRTKHLDVDAVRLIAALRKEDKEQIGIDDIFFDYKQT